MTVEISVIVPTRNRAASLRKCLQSLTEQTMPRANFEVIVVDNGSTDDTPETVGSFEEKLNIRRVFASRPGLHVGRHQGLRSAISDLLVFADDDIQAIPTWLDAMKRNFQGRAAMMVGGNNYPRFETEPPSWLMKLWDKESPKRRILASLSIIDLGEGAFPIDPGLVWGCNFGIRRSALMEAGGFHPDALPSDQILLRGDGETHVSNYVRNSGKPAIFDSDASVYHLVPSSRMTTKYFERRYFSQGISDSYRDIRNWGEVRRVKAWLWRQSFRYRSHARYLLNIGRSLDGQEQRKQEAMLLRWRQSYLAGYRAHQQATFRDPQLLAWVLQENYL